MVRRNGRRSQVQWQSLDLCRPDTAQYECEEREISSPGRRSDIGPTGGCKAVLKARRELGILANTPGTRILSPLTPFGRYRFNRLPFGISSAPEHFQRRMSEALTGLAGTVCMMDDILVYGETCEEHDQRLWTVLERLNDLGMTLNAEKCTFAQTSVKFLGHVIDSQGSKADPTKVEAIVNKLHDGHQGIP